MSNVRRTPAVHPDEIEKTLAFNEAHTSERLNHQVDRLVGGNRVMSGFRVEHLDIGSIRLMPGSFISGGVIVTLKSPLDLDYGDLLVDDALPVSGGRKKSIILWASCPDSSKASAVIFGFATDTDEADVSGDSFVHLAVLTADDTLGDSPELGRWVRPFGFSSEELARDLREGVQSVEAAPFVAQNGAARTSPGFAARPYFTHDHHLLVFADRWLLPNARYFSDPVVPYYGRRGLTGIAEKNVDPTDFDFGGKWPNSYNLSLASWGFVVSRDIEWQQVVVYPSEGSPPPYVTISRAVDQDDPRLLVFENGCYIPMAEVSVNETGTRVTLAAGATPGGVYHFVKLRDFVFEVTVPLEGPMLTPQAVDVSIPGHLFDVSRHTLMAFLRVTAGEATEDGGYVQVNRKGAAERVGQGVKVASGFTIQDAGKIRLHDVTLQDGVTCSVTILCVRGSTKENLASQDAAARPFYRRWVAVADAAPSEGKIRAFPDIHGFATAAPGAGQSISVALHGVDSDLLAPDGTEIVVGHFAGYRIEQGPAFESETGQATAPREIEGSSSPAYGSVQGFQGTWATTVLSVPSGAQAALAGSPLRLRGGRLVQGLPVYEIGSHRLQVAIDGVRLIGGVDFEETSGTSVTVHHELRVGQNLEVWVA